MKTPRFWLVLIALGCAAHLWVNYPALPERVATHFGGSGHADGWMSKRAFAQFQLGLTGAVAALLLGVGWLIQVLPADAINLPRREFWLAPSRRAETIFAVQTELSRFGAALMVFLLGVQEATIRANINQTFRLGPLFLIGMVGFLSFTAVWTIGFHRRFR
jgi:uncharacterized membrane protein